VSGKRFDLRAILCSELQSNRLLKNVTSKGKTRKNEAKKRSLHEVNEHFEPNFDTELSSVVVFQQPAKAGGGGWADPVFYPPR
jgi:ATP-dependent Clp protease ATP-binding subunit ClpA